MTRCAANCFDRWYQHVRRSIWVGAAQYALQQHGFDHDKATNEAKQLYEDLYADYNNRYHCWRRQPKRNSHAGTHRTVSLH